MEDVLVLAIRQVAMGAAGVLILVVVEDVLVHTPQTKQPTSDWRLNPCCGGRCSSTIMKKNEFKFDGSLNPCCGGRCSSTAYKAFNNQSLTSLNPCCGGRCSSTAR